MTFIGLFHEKQLLEIYKKALRIRLIEEAIANNYHDQKMRCPTHLSIGQELTPVVVSEFLTNKDKAYSGHRAHAHYLAKGGCLNKLIAELYGKQTGCTGGVGGSMHLSDLACGFVASTAIVGNSIPVAVGNALSQSLDGCNDITVVYFGDGATEEGVFYESINFAALKKLPILFVCENNFYSVYSPLHVRQPKQRNLCELVNSMGIKSHQFEGNQVDPLYDRMAEIVHSLRKGDGPCFIEAFTYRHREHCGPNFDDDLNYRDPDEIKSWLKKDPIFLLERQLDLSGSINDEFFHTISLEIQLAFREAISASSMPISAMQDLVYAK